MLADQGNLADALAKLEAAAPLLPKSRSVEVHLSLAEVALMQGEGDRALGELKSVVKEYAKDPLVLEPAARMMLSLGRPKDALAITEGVDDRRVHLVRGLARADQGDLEEAKKELINHVRKQIGALATPDQIRFTPALPKTRSGKIMRRLLRDIAAGRESKGDTTTLEDLSVLAKLREDDE